MKFVTIGRKQQRSRTSNDFTITVSLKKLLLTVFFGLGLAISLFVGFDHASRVSAEHLYNIDPDHSPLGPNGNYSAIDRIRTRQIYYSSNCLGADILGGLYHGFATDDACFRDGRVHGLIGMDPSHPICTQIEEALKWYTNANGSGPGLYGSESLFPEGTLPAVGVHIYFNPSALAAADTTWDPTFAYGILSGKTAILYDPSLRPDDDNNGTPDPGERGSRIYFDPDVNTLGNATCHPQLNAAYSCNNDLQHSCEMSASF